MPKKVRRAKSSKSLTSWPKVLLIIIPVFVVAFIIVRSSGGQNVLGVKDSSFFGLGERTKPSITPKPSPKPPCNRVTAFSASTICDNTQGKSNNIFKSYTYTCEDGVSGSVEQTKTEGRCLPIAKAYELARKACNKKCIPTKTPTTVPTSTTAE